MGLEYGSDGGMGCKRGKSSPARKKLLYLEKCQGVWHPIQDSSCIGNCLKTLNNRIPEYNICNIELVIQILTKKVRSRMKETCLQLYNE